MKVGNSLGVTVPADFVTNIGIKAGDMVEVEKEIEKGKLIYKFSGIQQLQIAANFLNKERKRKQ